MQFAEIASIRTIWGRIKLRDSDGKLGEPQWFIKINGQIYPLSRLGSTIPVRSEAVEVSYTEDWESNYCAGYKE